MIASRLGEFAALLTAFCWTFGALSFESACKRAGALAVNWIRLVLGFVFIALFRLISAGTLLPLDATAHNWLWLFLSGIIGFAIGDLLLFQAFVVIGARISMLVMASVPPITALIGWTILGETLSFHDLTGMVLTVIGIVLVVLEQNPEQKNQIKFSHPVSGVLFALGGAVGQAVGLVLSKHGMGEYNAFAATQIRILAGILGFSIILFLFRRWSRVGSAVRNRKALAPTSLGAFLGPFLGVSFSLLSVQHTTTGVASTIMAIVPVLIIPPAVILFKERITTREVVGAVIAVTGVALLFL